MSSSFTKHMQDYFDGLPNDTQGQFLTEEMKLMLELEMPYIKVLENPSDGQLIVSEKTRINFKKQDIDNRLSQVTLVKAETADQ